MNETIEPRYAAIFDMDGVLLDSPVLNWKAMNQVLASYDVQISDNEVKKYLGRTLEDQVSQFNQDYNLGLDYGDFKEATDEIKRKLFAVIQPKEGVVDMLEELKSNGIPRAVATSMPRDLTEQRLKTAGILDYFDAIVTEEDVEHHKPDPEVFERAAHILGAAALSCIVFEDAPAGVEAAKSAGMWCVAIRTSFVPRHKLNNADAVIDSFAEITTTELDQLVAS